MMKPIPPQVGQTYTSTTDPSLKVLVERVLAYHHEEPGFVIECCDPATAHDPAAVGFEFLDSEWEEHGFQPT